MDYLPESEGSDDEDYMEDEDTKIERKQRAGVSAEVYGEHNKKEDYKPRVIKKTDGQMKRIEEKMKKIFIFSALDKNETKIVVDAMEEKKFK